MHIPLHLQMQTCVANTFLLGYDRDTGGDKETEGRYVCAWAGWGLMHSGWGASVVGEAWDCKVVMSHGSLLWTLKSSGVTAGEKVEKQVRG